MRFLAGSIWIPSFAVFLAGCSVERPPASGSKVAAHALPPASAAASAITSASVEAPSAVEAPPQEAPAPNKAEVALRVDFGAPVTIACKAKWSCTEMRVGGALAGVVRDNCRNDQGNEPIDGACSRANVRARCVVASEGMTIFFYPSPFSEKSRLLGAKMECEKEGGVFK